jgi:multiple sugar transport system ATP-binding protein
MVFQSYALYPHMTVAGNLAFGLKLRGHDKAAIAARVGEAARMLGIEDLLDRKPAALSGGQRQRVALGRALVRQPQVFLLDEPLSNLDARLRAAMRVEIARLHRKLGATMVYVTHDQVEAMTLGERIVVLDGGRIRQVDTPMALYERPADVFVATFLGSPAMNVVPGRLEVEGAGFVTDDGVRIPLPGLQPAPEWSGRPLLLGVRPEHLVRAEPADAAAGAFAAVVEVVEPVGNEVFVNLRLGAHALVARLPPGVLPKPGESLWLRVAVAQAHVFDGEPGADGRRLVRGVDS